MAGQVSWSAVRVSADTKAQLEQLREQFIAEAHRMKEPIGSDETRSGRESKRDEIGLDQVIRKLIRSYRDHAQRAKRSAQKRRQPPTTE